MGACEPGQGGNAAAISIAFMCPGAPPRLSPAPAAALDAGPAVSLMSHGGAPWPEPGPTERASWPRPTEPGRTRGRSARAYTVVARRYRPQRFEDVVGQDHVVQSLRNAIRMNRRHPRLPLLRHPGRRQDVDRPDLRQVPELRARADRRALPQAATSARRSPSARTSTSSRSTAPATTASSRSASCARTPACGPAGRGSRSTTSTKSTCSRPAPSTPC